MAACLLGTAAAQKPPTERAKEAELKQLQSRIESIKKGIESDVQKRDSLASGLKASELAVQSARQKVAAVRAERIASEKRLDELTREKGETERRIATERSALAAELRSAYINGAEEQLVVLLNQQNPAEIGRTMTYYGYFGRARAERIATITDQLAHVQLLTDKAVEETERLRSIEESHTRETEQLAKARQNRAQTLAAIQSKIRTRSDQAQNLERQAKALQKLIDEMQRAAQELPALPAKGFGRAQGKLPWPVSGKILAGFGTPRGGGPLKWEGILIGAAPGSQVKALFHGRVVYADHLYGMGLMVMIDHGDGYSSIYGHHEQLFVKVGDSIAPGEIIGVLADQGGANGNSKGELHLEIRRGKSALDPKKWLRKP